MRKLNLEIIDTVRESYNSKREEIIDETGRHKACPYNQRENINNNTDSIKNDTHCRGTVHRARIENGTNIKFISIFKNARTRVGAGLDSARDHRAITLIALIITIIVLLILAGVALNFVLGENGILKQAEFAKNKYQNASEQEQADLEAIFGYLENQTLPDNTPTTDAGTPVKIPNQWQTETPNYIRTTDGKIITSSTKIATVTAISDGTGNTIPVPAGFYYVGGTLDSGVVISDQYEDSYEKNKRDMTSHEDAINLIGNQFVWIPCEASKYVKSNWSNNGKTQGNVSNRSNCYWSTSPNDEGSMQVKKYGGFYVSRYEAGIPQGTTEYKDCVIYNSDCYNSITGTPQSKADVSPWNFIDWNNSKAKAEKMYEGKANVSSGLVTGTQWDVMINKIGSLKDENGNIKYSLLDSASWGNYYTGDSNGFIFRGDVSEYKSDYQYAFKTPTSTTKLNSTYLYILKTGASEHNLTYNIYDVAGNLKEWTEESAAYYNSVESLATNRVFRSGSFVDTSFERPACFRSGYNDAAFTYYNVGFRVVLYMK